MKKHLNLLPELKQRELYYEKLYHSISVAVALSVMLLLAGVVVQILTWFYLNRSQVTVANEIDVLQQSIDKSETATLKQEIKDINNQMIDFDNLAKQTPLWSNVIVSFSNLVPEGVLIDQFTADAETGEVDISGFSPSRELVIELYNNINSDKENFKDINYPLENVAKPTQVRFNYTFFINPEVLVPKVNE